LDEEEEEEDAVAVAEEEEADAEDIVEGRSEDGWPPAARSTWLDMTSRQRLTTDISVAGEHNKETYLVKSFREIK